jgi:hypothetical protein
LVGRTKVPYQELFSLSRNELKALIEGHEIDQKEFVESLRLHASITVSPHVRKEDKSKIEPKRLWPLPWDKKAVSKPNKGSISKVKKLAEIYRSGKIIPKNNGDSKN